MRPFKTRRAQLRARRVTGGNAAVMLAVVELGQLASSDLTGTLGPLHLPRHLIAGLVVGSLVGGALVLGTGNRVGQAVLAIAGVTVGFVNATVTAGPVGLLVTIAVVAMALWLVGFVRGLS